MSWTPDLHIGELRPWPDAVRVVRGNTGETMLYTVTPLPHFWTGDGTLHMEPRKLPERIDVTLPDERGREVHSARVRRYVPERTCNAESYDDGVDEGMDGDWYAYAPPTWFMSCGHQVEGAERPKFCPSCGAKVVDLREKSQEDA